MSVLDQGELYPSHCRAVGRSASFLKSVTLDDLVEHLAPNDAVTASIATVRKVAQACMAMGMLVPDPDNDLNLCVADEWISGLGEDSTSEDFMLCVSRNMTEDNSELGTLFVLSRWVLKSEPFSSMIGFEEAIKEEFEDNERPFAPNVTQQSQALRWLNYMGLVRVLGNLYVPDMTRWLEIWLRGQQKTSKESFETFWDEMKRDFPLLGGVDTSPLPASIGLAMGAIQRRGKCQWEDMPDTDAPIFTWLDIASKTRCSHVTWTCGGVGA